jgi:hypothetical protein
LVGLILRSGKAKYFTIVESTEKIATYETWRIGSPKAVRYSFTDADAQRAGLVKPNSNHAKYPKTMLQWRAAACLGRLEYPDIAANTYVLGEIREDEAIEAELLAAGRAA